MKGIYSPPGRNQRASQSLHRSHAESGAFTMGRTYTWSLRFAPHPYESPRGASTKRARAPPTSTAIGRRHQTSRIRRQSAHVRGYLNVSGVLHVAWYRFRVTFGGRWGGYLTVVLVVGILGAMATGVVGAARRTQSSFPTYHASTNPSNLSVFTGTGAESRPVHLPEVRRVEGVDALNALPLGPNGAPKVVALANEAFTVGSEGLSSTRIGSPPVKDRWLIPIGPTRPWSRQRPLNSSGCM